MESMRFENMYPENLSDLVADRWNLSHHQTALEQIKMDSNFAWLMGSLVSAIAWIIYITYYNSRISGYFMTNLLNRFVIHTGFFKIGSFTLNVLSGKIMFRDVIYITEDYSVRIQDGYLIFRWWRSYVPKDVSEDLSHSDTRLSVVLNGFELHVYNRSDMYGHLEKLFGLEPNLLPNDKNQGDPDASLNYENLQDTMESENLTVKHQRSEAAMARTWRDLIPVIKMDVCSGRLVFGNRLVPTTLSINVEEAHFVYSTKPAASSLDHFMHFAKCKAENFKVILAPSPKYTGMVDDPPRYMGEGFVIMSSNNVELYTYMDEPGIVPEEPVLLRLANGDVVESAPPVWGIDIKCGKGTDFSYGPWADRQRDNLFKFFFPPDWQPLKVTKAPKPGDRRQMQSFDIRLSTLNEATIDILFSKNKETNAVHVNIGAGSYLEVTLPWIVLQDGYTTKITGQLLHLDATTSLQYRSLVESETLEYTVKCHYPIRWNDHQEWVLNLTGCKATANLVYSHKDFFQDLINDWASKARPDLLHFVPYTWKINLLLKEFEIITISNEYNWVDCSSHNKENCHLAFCGDLFDLSFDLPFVDFLPSTIPLRFWIQGESVDLSMFIPEVYTTRNIVLSLDKNAKVLARDGSIRQRNENIKKWRNVCQKDRGWIDCWSVPIVALSINYTYHPCPPLGPVPQADISTPDKEELLLSPIRFPHNRKVPPPQNIHHWQQDSSKKFDPTSLPADQVSLELEIGPSVMFVYGTVLRNFMHLKENIFGEDQSFTDMQQSRSSETSVQSAGTQDSSMDERDSVKVPFDPRFYRPLEVNVSVTMHDIQAHLVKNCNEADPACPVVVLERFGFELKKNYRQTELQVLLSPSILLTADNVVRPGKDLHLNQGHLMLSALQIRGHAMFSDESRSLDEDTLEYAWLLEIQLGKLSGKITTPQLYHVVTSLETLVLLAVNAENTLRPPRPARLCLHGIPPAQCPDSDSDTRYRCPSAEDIKYRMTRVAVDAVDITLVENGTALQTWISPIRFSVCNLHGQQIKSGITCILPLICIRQYILAAGHYQGGGGGHSNTNTTSSSKSNHTTYRDRGYADTSDHWLEVGSVNLGPIIVESALSLSTFEHNLHLVQSRHLRIHDEKTKRLWFLWPNDPTITKAPGRCGCNGGCAFFGSNRNGPKFFKPSKSDIQDGVNIAAFRIQEAGKDPGFGQSILHEGQLVFHTPPYSLQDVSLQEPTSYLKPIYHPEGMAESPRVRTSASTMERDIPSQASGRESVDIGLARLAGTSASPLSFTGETRSSGRRFSYTTVTRPAQSAAVSALRDVPYARLVDSSPTSGAHQLPHKLDSDSKLNSSERSKSILNVPEVDFGPKNSASDSKLAVDYFYTPPNEPESLSVKPLTGEEISMQNDVNISESHHSLYVRADSEEQLRQEVQRTISMSSENHSEAFFSADEDLNSASRASSLRRSMIGSGSVLNRQESHSQKKKFASDLSIVADSKKAQAKMQSTIDGDSGKVSGRECSTPRAGRLSAHRSDHDIHTPEHRTGSRRPSGVSSSIQQLGSASPRLFANGENLHNVYENQNQDIDSSDTPSISSTSFMSAVSSQEDMTLVNLHMQVNKPIVDSPLLMSSYVGHLSHSRCLNWQHTALPPGSDMFTVPLFQRTDDGRLVYIGGRYLPKFETISEGFTSLKMVNRGDGNFPTSPQTDSRTPTHPYTWDSNQMFTDADFETDHETGVSVDDELLSTTPQSGTRTTVVIKLKGDLDVMVTPLILESLQRFIDALTPTLQKLHPLTVVNHVHAGCIGTVQDANILKQDQSLSYWSQIQSSSNSRSNTAERRIAGHLQTSVYEESLKSELQGTVIVPKVNITVLQASVVEEIISFSALDNIKDLTCVSLFAVCFENITARFHHGKQVKEIVQTFHHPSILPVAAKKTTIANLMAGANKIAASGSHRTGAGNTGMGKDPTCVRASSGSRASNTGSTKVSHGDALGFMNRGNSMAVKPEATTSTRHDGTGSAISEGSVDAEGTGGGGDLERMNSGNGGAAGSKISASSSVGSSRTSAIANAGSKTPLSSRANGNTTATTTGTTKPQSVAAAAMAGLGSNAHISKGKALLAAVVSRTGLRGAKHDTLGSEPVFIETQERQQEETVVTLSVGKVHAQLRRLRNESTILKDAVITAIPTQNSKVLFTCTKVPSPHRTVDYYAQPVQHENTKHSLSQQHSVEEPTSGNGDSKLGFIMFESGLEGVSVKIVKHSQYHKDEEEEHTTIKTETETHASGTSDPTKQHEDVDKTQHDSASGQRVNKPPVKNTPSMDSSTTVKSPIVEGTDSDCSTLKDAGTNTETTTITGQTTVAVKEKGNENTSSCVIDVKTVWFNFAAPPHAPITRKLDYTRLDWNLLSTASPAINAWLSPSNRFAIRVVHMHRSYYRRTTGVIACLMAEALDVQAIHMPIKSRYGRLTPLAKTLQEDPSCQLSSVLQKYMLQSDLSMIEHNLREADMPNLSTLRQGVIVLSRQWKSVLYTPLLLEHNYKTKFAKPLNVTFAVPELDEIGLTDGENSAEDTEPIDECAVLLAPQNGDGQPRLIPVRLEEQAVPGPPVNSPRAINTPVTIVAGGIESVLTSPSPPSVPLRHKRNKSLQPTQLPSSSRASIVFPLLSGSIPFSQRRHDEEIGYGTLKEEKLTSSNLEHLGSNPSLYSIPGPTSQTGSLPSEHVAAVGSPRSSGGHAISTTGKASLHRNAKHGSAEDLYSWMAKQQDYIRDKLRRDNHSKKDKVDPLITVNPTNVGSAPLTATTNGAGQYSLLYPLHDSLRLLDAHIIFQPLLSSLGVIPQQMVSSASISNNTAVSSLDSLGSNLSLVGGMETMRIDIVVSQEHGTNRRPRQSQGKSKQNTGTKFHLDIPNETPAFLCEKIGLEMELNKMADMAVDDMIQRQNVLYISRGQLKKHTSTVLNVSLNIRYISQQVNMPLLRLLHQITNMYQNVKETQLELREQQPEIKVGVNDRIINKNDSSSTSDLQEHTLVENKLTLKVSDPISIISQSRPTISPSPSIRSRPQSFAQKLRGKSIKGYMNLSDGGASPILPNSPSGSAIDRMTISSDKDTTLFNLTPKCWKTVYYLLDLYATMPETKTIAHRFSVAPDISEHYKGNRKYDLLTEVKSTENIEKGEPLQKPPTPALTARELNVVAGERTRLVVLGVVRIHRTRLLATLSGLKLEAEITALHSSLTCRKKLRPASLECSLTGQVGRTMIVLLEGVPPNQQTVVKVTVGKSQALYSTITKRGKDKNSGLLTVGAINIDIPQHPVALHDMMTRGSKQLSSTLQELRVTRTSSRMSRTGALPDEESPHHQWRAAPPERPVHATAHSNIDGAATGSRTLLQPLVMQFSVVLQSLSITAALLPSLRAQYKMDQVNSTGVTGSKAKFTIDLPHHSLSFTTKLQATEANLPSEASIELPKVHVSAEYVQDGGTNQSTLGGMLFEGGKFSDGVVLRRGSYMSATADIGVFEHSLTTDLLNHLVFVQKVFMKEVNEVVQKVYGAEKPVPIWLDDSTTSVTSSTSRILFSLMIRIKRIQLTATTPTNSAVRLETGAVELELSNRVQNVSGAGVSALHSDCGGAVKLFGRAKVDVNLSLGQLIRNVMFEEAEPEFQQFAFFNTRIELRNAFQDEMVEGNDKEVVLITLKRPLIYIQPMAVDKAILVWLNYKNAYEYWTEKRANLNKEVLTATQQVFEKVPFGQLTSQLSAPHTGTLFLQLTVEDMGICLPLNPLPLNSWGQRGMFDSESRAAVVVTLERTSISACSSGSLVSKAGFVGLCLRFADDFETSLDEWKPDMTDAAIMNYCVVSEGTYEVCSRTIAAKQGLENAKWFLNVQWKMEGVDIHLDVNVGKQLSALGHTLTMLTGAEEDEQIHLDYDSDDADQVDGIKTSQESILVRTNKKWTDSLPAFIFDPSLDAKERSKLIEKEMNEQAKIINDLRSLGASHGTIQQEMKRLHELEAMVFKDFRRDMIQKLRRQSSKTSTLKGKMGLSGPKSSTYRSRSFIVPSPTPEHHLESPVELSTIPGSTPVNTHSFDSSPRSGPSRSASLKVRSQTLASPTSSGSQPKVTFGDAHAMCRQSSLPSAGSELSLPEGDLTWIDHIDIDGEKVEIRRKSPSYESSYEDNFDGSAPLLESFAREQSVSYAPPLPTSQQQKTQEPNIDFELDVKVLINSGKCVLHTKDTVKEEEIKISTRMRKERSSSSAGMTDWSSPASPNLNRTTGFTGGKIGSNEKSNQTSNMPQQHWSGGSGAGRHGGGSYGSTTCCPLTVFHIPAMDIRVHYTSSTTQPSERNDPETSPRFMSDHSFSASQTMPSRKTAGIKKASLFAWMTLQSVPEETIVSPHILEFLEQTLEPIPSKTSFSFPGASTGAADNETTYGNYVYASFPVDVIVYFHMQPSTFRFSCLPVSRVECMLQLPSLDIVFSSKRAEEDLSTIKDGKPNTAATAIGGLSVTGCLADFSVYIFHPYGGGKKSSLKESQWSPLSDSERKDSLSINVEFVKFHLSRSRKLNFHSDMATKMGKQLPDHSRACIRFSTIVTIGSASFKYDMRRLTEILAFPRAWYRRSIMRRLFLGDLSLSTSTQNDNTPTFQQNSDEHGSRYTTDADHNPMSARDKLKLNLESDVARHARLKEIGKNWSMESDETETPSPNETTTTTAWETLVLFAVNFTRLNVHMNMGNVMGNVTWQTKDFRSDGRLSIGSTGHKNLFIGLGLGGSSLDAKGGIVGGTIEIANIDTYIHIREEPFQEPDHTVGLRLLALELRLDYMGTSVLMARVSALDVTLRDEWKLARANSTADTAMFMPTRRPAVIFMHGDLGWDQLQLMISKSTTADLLKMFNKLDEFFSQQFKSSKRVFSSLQPRPTQPSMNLKRRLQTQQTLRGRKGPPNSSVQQTGDSRDTWNTQMQQSVLQDAKHHRHWQNVLACAAKLHLPTLKIPLPSSGTVLGGTMELHGKNISLACFHGINFKSKSWALFSLKEPCISFATEAQEIPSTAATDQLDVHIVQTLTFSLGINVDKQTAHHESMATVCRMSRNIIFPPQFKTLQEWFHYAFANSEIDAVDRFPSLEREKLENSGTNSIERSRGSSGSSKLQDPNHTREVIFALPCLQLHLKTEHLQTATTPDVMGEKPVVDCSFVTEFEDHIFVTVDAEAFFFLHDLITSYVKEKERVGAISSQSGLRSQSPDPRSSSSVGQNSSSHAKAGSSGSGTSAHSEDDKKNKDFSPGEVFDKDWRRYHCKTWHLEPTVRLLSWAGKSIEPYGIDYILQKLGFSHARTTIPKWMQRGFMDPLDKLLALLMLRMISNKRQPE